MKKQLLIISLFALIGLSANSQNYILPEFNNSIPAGSFSNCNRSVMSVNYRPGKETDYNWDTTLNVWKFADSIRNYYDFSGKLVRDTTYFGTNQELVLCTYDGNGHLLNYLIKYNFCNFCSMSNIAQYNFTYDVNGNETSFNLQSWNGVAWKDNFKYVYSYDTYNNNIQSFYYKRDTTAGVWNPSSSQNYTYDATQQCTQIISQTRDTVTHTYHNNQKNAISYSGSALSNPANGVTTNKWNGASWQNYEQSTSANFVASTWTGLTGPFNVFNILTNNNLHNQELNEVDQVWKPGTSTWQDTLRSTNTYDVNHNQTNALSENKPATTWNTYNEITHAFMYDGNQNMTEDIYQKWVPFLQAVRNNTKKDYSDYFLYTGIAEMDYNREVTIFPNPSTGIIYLQNKNNKIAAVVIYNIVGEKIYQSENNNSFAEIDLTRVQKGIYFVQITDENKSTINKKIIIQ